MLEFKTVDQAREHLRGLRTLDSTLCAEMAELIDDKSYEASARRQAIAEGLRNRVRPRIAECVKFISLHS